MIHTLAIDSVELCFGDRVILQGGHISVQTGEVAGLLGRNGCGKTCLLNIIHGTRTGQYGTLKIDDTYTTEAFKRPGLIMYAPQYDYTPGGLRVERVFDDYGLDFVRFTADFPEYGKLRRNRMRELSGGERRVVELYLVLASPVKFVLLDEPFSQVMPLHIERIKSLIRREKANKGIIITDHMYRHILDISDRVYLLANRSSYVIKKDTDLARLGYVSWKEE